MCPVAENLSLATVSQYAQRFFYRGREILKWNKKTAQFDMMVEIDQFDCFSNYFLTICFVTHPDEVNTFNK